MNATPLYRLSDETLLAIASDLSDPRHDEARNEWDARSDHRNPAL